jgi:hypothetical protein
MDGYAVILTGVFHEPSAARLAPQTSPWTSLLGEVRRREVRGGHRLAAMEV